MWHGGIGWIHNWRGWSNLWELNLKHLATYHIRCISFLFNFHPNFPHTALLPKMRLSMYLKVSNKQCWNHDSMAWIGRSYSFSCTNYDKNCKQYTTACIGKFVVCIKINCDQKYCHMCKELIDNSYEPCENLFSICSKHPISIMKTFFLIAWKKNNKNMNSTNRKSIYRTITTLKLVEEGHLYLR